MNQNFNLLKYFVALVLILASAACAGKKKPSPPVALEQPKVLADLREFPQNLLEYAKQDKKGRLLSAPAQTELAEAFIEIYFGPWEMRKTTVRKRDVAPFFRKARGYKNASDIWIQPEWDRMLANAALDDFPTRATPGITLRQTDLRELPTHVPRFSEPTSNIRENPFDYFQYSLLWPGMPLLIAHTTRDGRWHYIECPIASGWVDARDVAIAGGEFQVEYRTGRYAALVKDKVRLPGIGVAGGDGNAGIGTVLPLAPGGAALSVLLPVANAQGYAEAAETPLAKTDAAIMPIPLTALNVASVGNAMMNQPYGWGGTNGDRDCSAMMRDLFTPFGIWLPRNSAAQARRGEVVSLAGLDARGKARVICEKGEPFLSLLGLPGHIGLYIGEWRGRPAMFHNAWGLRIVKDGNDNERHVIGKAVVTSIEPGSELENLYRPTTFTDRVRSLTRLGGNRR